MTDDDVLDTKYLLQPRGPGTGYVFRMLTPAALMGQTNPRTQSAYGREIRVGLKTRSLREARTARDILLGAIRQQEQEFLGWQGTTEEAIELAKNLRPLMGLGAEDVAASMARVANTILAPRIGQDKAKNWHKVAMGKATPVRALAEKYHTEHEDKLSPSTLNNLNTALKELYEFGGKDILAESIDRQWAGSFVTSFLPNKASPRAGLLRVWWTPSLAYDACISY
ncbi:MAG: Uncharacterized protein FD119_3737, partial [Stygiobacter sp.]